MDQRSKVTVIPPLIQYTTRVAIYCRVSTERRDQLNSLTNQISFLTRYVGTGSVKYRENGSKTAE